MQSSKNKFHFNSVPPKSKADSNLHNYYKSYADQKKTSLAVTNSEQHKSLSKNKAVFFYPKYSLLKTKKLLQK